ncbi:hypothetical protein [Adhaeribacter aerolatus]|uniref:hypothetical protein n=1 Tax=Adhaeribacter aerolatus TaxID=670289 RepID=UPI0011BF4580|nr:hypothetical protein [Adhaeribacter aerolatus]
MAELLNGLIAKRLVKAVCACAAKLPIFQKPSCIRAGKLIENKPPQTKKLTQNESALCLGYIKCSQSSTI